MPNDAATFVYETHSVHAGTMGGPIKHGIDDIDQAIQRAIELGHPSLAFIIHSPRLTTFRYRAEEALNRKFIRGDTAYAGYVKLMEDYRRRYEGRIHLRFGVELEWQGLGLGETFSRGKIEQALGADYIVGSVHFSRERIGYDDSPPETQRLLELRGSLEAFWEGYFEEVISMVDTWGDYIHVVGHIDLPKLYAPVPDSLRAPSTAGGTAAGKLRVLLAKLADRGIALDLNVAGDARGCGAYPTPEILRLARDLGVEIALGTDTHAVADLGRFHGVALDRAREAGLTHYLSFSHGWPRVHLLDRHAREDLASFEPMFNTGLALLSQVDNHLGRRVDLARVKVLLGAGFAQFAPAFPGAVVLGPGRTVSLRKDGHSVTVGESSTPAPYAFRGIHFRHHDRPGILALLVSILASEGINIDTAYLRNNGDGTGSAWIAVSGRDAAAVAGACEFALGTNADHFLELVPDWTGPLPEARPVAFKILAIDDAGLDMAPSRAMVHSVHEDRPGLLLLLLAALAARGINVLDLSLTQTPGRGHALLSVDGPAALIRSALDSIRSDFESLSCILLDRDDSAPSVLTGLPPSV